MKKTLFTTVLFFLLISAYPQQDIKHAIRGGRGVSNYSTTVNANEKIQFNGSALKMLFGLNANADLVLMRAGGDKLGYTHYRYYQTYKNIPVENTMYVVHTRSGLVKSMSGLIVTDFDAAMDKRITASITANNAVETAIKYVGAQLYAWKDAGMQEQIRMQTGNSKATYEPQAKLVWYSPGETISPRELRLCYKVDVYAISPLSRADYFVDAITGQVIGKQDKIYFSDATGTAKTFWSGNQTIHSDLKGTSYRLRDYSRGTGVITLHGESAQRGKDYTSISPDWTLKGSNIAALDAHYGAEQTYSFYMANFSRNSYDDAGTALYSYVNDPTYTDNAFWDGGAMNYNKRSTGDAGGVTGIDVAGHELTHGVTQTTCALVYFNEPGAINESLSDIMGKSVQFWAKPADKNWQLSNDMNWIIRDMSNPNLHNQPDTYLGTFWSTSSRDNGGVHFNSGVGNFMFYLLVNGGSGTNDIGNNYSVNSIGLKKADQIIYRSQTVYLTSISKYIDWRIACINAAEDLYGDVSNEVDQVKNAFYAVGIGPSSTGCDIPIGLSATNIKQTTAKLTWEGVSGVSRYNLQRKFTTSNVWTTVSGLTTNSYNASGLGAGFSYDFRVESICSNGVTTSGYSNPFTFTTLSNGPAYCPAKGESTEFEYINRVSIDTIGFTSGNNNGYGNFTSLRGQVKAGNTCTLELTAGFAGGSISEENWYIFVDYNADGDFADAGETVGTAISTGRNPAHLTFTIPAGAKKGITRMRIKMSYNSIFTDPCLTFSYGEVEDYGLNISGGAPITSASSTDANGLATLRVVPNPVKNSSVQVSIELKKQGNVTIRVSDLSGKLFLSKTIAGAIKGKNNFILTGTEKLTRGIFMIIAEQDNTIIGRSQLIVE